MNTTILYRNILETHSNSSDIYSGRCSRLCVQRESTSVFQRSVGRRVSLMASEKPLKPLGLRVGLGLLQLSGLRLLDLGPILARTALHRQSQHPQLANPESTD